MYLPLFSCYVRPNVKSRKVDDSQISTTFTRKVDERLKIKFLVHNFIYNLVTSNGPYNLNNPYFYVRNLLTSTVYNKKTYYLLFISTLGQAITRMYFMNRFKSIEYNDFIKACLFTVKDDIINQIIYDNDIYNIITSDISNLDYRKNNAYKIFILSKLGNVYEYKELVQDFTKLLLERINILKRFMEQNLGDLAKSLSNTIFESIKKAGYDFSVNGEIFNIQNKDSGKIDFQFIFMFSVVLSKFYFIIDIKIFDGVQGRLNKIIHLISEVKKEGIVTSCHRKYYKTESEIEYKTFFTDLVSTYNIREVYNILVDKIGLTTSKIKIKRN